ncbi:MAG: transposase [Bryobacteraceae bacterium]
MPPSNCAPIPSTANGTTPSCLVHNATVIFLQSFSSDGGAFLLRQTDQRLNLLPRLTQCFLDGRDQDLIKHSVREMLSQRVYGLALGYEDLSDHEQLRKDPVFAIVAGREDLDEPLAGKSTLNRMRNARKRGTS